MEALWYASLTARVKKTCFWYHSQLGVHCRNGYVMDDHSNDMTKRFITLVDEFYDRNVKLIITAAANPNGLYTGSRLAKAFKRTISRLEEMRTHDYLAKQHLP